MITHILVIRKASEPRDEKEYLYRKSTGIQIARRQGNQVDHIDCQDSQSDWNSSIKKIFINPRVASEFIRHFAKVDGLAAEIEEIVSLYATIENKE